jgi:hypothetical protein
MSGSLLRSMRPRISGAAMRQSSGPPAGLPSPNSRQLLAHQTEGGIDERNVRESLGEIPEEPTRTRVIFLG